MYGLKNFVIVVVVNGFNQKPTNFFDRATTISVAALNSIKAGTTGNIHARSDVQKQAYPSELVKSVRSAYGLTGTNFDTHTPYISGKKVSLDQALLPETEIFLIKNDLVPSEAIKLAGVHSVIPSRTNPALY